MTLRGPSLSFLVNLLDFFQDLLHLRTEVPSLVHGHHFKI